MKKALLTAGVLVCLAIACGKIWEFYQDHKPPFAVGECFVVADQNFGDIQFRVAANDVMEAQSQLVGSMEYLPGLRLESSVTVTFEQIREAGAKKADCQ